MYESYYKLDKTPFSATPDPDFFFTSSGHREALAALIYGIQYRKGFISLIGEVGTGKTTVLRSYIHSRYAKNLKLVYVFNPKLSYDDFLTVVLREFTKEIPATEVEKADLLHRYLVAYYEKNINVVIVIDEAQNTPGETLESMRMLSNIETTKHKLVQIVLAGQPELEVVLANHNLRQLRQRLALNIQLSALTRKESLAYIDHRAKRAGATDSLFTVEALDWIVDHGDGIPRKLNMICDNALITGFGSDQFPIGIDVLIEIEPELKLLGIARTGKWPQKLSPATADEVVTEHAFEKPNSSSDSGQNGVVTNSPVSELYPVNHNSSVESMAGSAKSNSEIEVSTDAASGLGTSALNSIESFDDQESDIQSSNKDRIRKKVLGDSEHSVYSEDNSGTSVGERSEIDSSAQDDVSEYWGNDYGTVRIVPRDNSAIKGTSEHHATSQIEKFEKRLESQTTGTSDLLFETKSNLFNHSLNRDVVSGVDGSASQPAEELSLEKSGVDDLTGAERVASPDAESDNEFDDDFDRSQGETRQQDATRKTSVTTGDGEKAKRDDDEDDEFDPVAYVRTNRVVKASRPFQRFKKFW